MIHILCADISGAEDTIYRRLYEKASPERKARADRYLRQEDRLCCVVSDALLQTALGTAHYQIEKNEFGKPYVKDHPGFHYNLSHSGRYVVIAWGDSEVGVDVQQHAPVNRDALAKRWFTTDEQTYMNQHPEQSSRRFFEIWTAKESYVKYIGKGLHFDIRAFSVLMPDPKIHYHHLSLDDGYSLSLCSADPAYTFALLDIRQL